MLLIAFVVGVAFAWLVEKGKPQLKSLRTWALHKKGRVAGTVCKVIDYFDDPVSAGRALYVLVLGLFIAAVSILALGIYGRYSGDLSSYSVRFLYFVTLPVSLSAIIGFAAGAAAFWLGPTIKGEYRNILVILGSRRPAEVTAKPGDNSSASNAKDTYPWLTGIVGIAAVTVVATIALVVFFPEVLSRVESIKVAGLEARFATSASSSVRIQNAAENHGGNYNAVLNKWRGVERTFESQVQSVRLKFLEEYKSAPSEFKKRNDEAEESEKKAKNFLTEFAVPLSHVMSCYSKDFSAPRVAPMQRDAASLANEWASFIVLVLRENAAGNLQAKEKWKRSFDDLSLRLTEFIKKVDEDLVARNSRCGLSSTLSPYGADKPRKDAKKLDDLPRRDAMYFADDRYLKLKASATDLPAIFSNGYVVAFIADKIMFTQSPEQALEFLDAVAPYMDDNEVAITGRFNFFTSRANMRYRSEIWTLKDWIADARATRSIALTITRKFTGKGFDKDKAECAGTNDNMGRYYCALVARTTNDLIYGHVREWLSGRHISPQALLDTDEWASQLHAWLGQQSHAELLTNETEISASSRVNTMANSYDTLALYELLGAAIKSELTKDRCGRALALLYKSRDVWEALHAASAVDHAETYRGAINIFRAHESLLLTACPS